MIENTYIQNMLNSAHVLPLFPKHFVLRRYRFAKMMPWYTKPLNLWHDILASCEKKLSLLSLTLPSWKHVKINGLSNLDNIFCFCFFHDMEVYDSLTRKLITDKRFLRLRLGVELVSCHINLTSNPLILAHSTRGGTKILV